MNIVDTFRASNVDFHALLDRLTNTSGPDRSIDAAMTVAFELHPPGGGWMRNHEGSYIQDEGSVRRLYADGSGMSGLYAPWNFTGSIDVTDSLLTRLKLTWSKHEDGRVRVADPSNDYFWWAGGATLPIRMCIGAVRCSIERDAQTPSAME